MKLVCFPNNAAGGLVCDLLNRNTVSMDGYKTSNQEHSLFKFSDSQSIQWNVDRIKWYLKLSQHKGQDKWFGTHCHPTGIPDLNEFDQVLSINVTTRNSKLYRWIRSYYGYFLKQNTDWQENNDIRYIDPAREFAKTVFESFTPSENCQNVEFEDIVSGKFIIENNLDLEQFQHWKEANSFLYSFTESDWCVRRFIEAEFEIENNEPWQYN